MGDSESAESGGPQSNHYCQQFSFMLTCFIVIFRLQAEEEQNENRSSENREGTD